MKKAINLLVLLSISVALWWHFTDVLDLCYFQKIGNVIDYTQTIQYDVNQEKPYKVTYNITFKDLNEGKTWKESYTTYFKSKDKINTTFRTRKLVKDKEWYRSRDSDIPCIYCIVCLIFSVFFVVLCVQSCIYNRPGNGCSYCQNKICHWHNAPPNPLLKEKFLICLHNIKSALFRFFS